MPFDSGSIIKLPRLALGDTLGIIAPSSPFNKQKFRNGLLVIEEMGFKSYYPEEIFDQKGYLAGSDAQRADILNNMFADPDIKGLICARGGYGALRILSLLDLKMISLNPKILIGCSDVTVLLNTLYAKCGLVSLHGPMIESLANASGKTIRSLQSILLDNQLISLQPAKSMVIHPGQASGTLAGGNLTTLSHLVGTPFEPDYSGQILLLEDIGEAPYRIDRMLTQMKLSGCFDNISGIVLGSFKGCGEPDQIYQIFDDIFLKECFPILAGFDIGHDEPNMSIPFGINASFDTASGLLKFNESLFSKL